MEFDPLENILSDSSNESFFGMQCKVGAGSTTPLGEPSAGRKSDSGIISKFSRSISKERAVDSDILIGSSCKTSPIRVAVTSSKNLHRTPINAKESELINDLGFDPKKPKTGKIDFSNLLGGFEASKFSRQSTETSESFTPGTYTKLRQKTLSNKEFTSSVGDPLGFLTFNKQEVSSSQCKDNKDMQKRPVRSVDDRFSSATADKQGKEKEVSSEVINTADDGENHEPNSLLKAEKSASLERGDTELQNSLYVLKLEEARLVLDAQLKMQQQLLFEMKTNLDSVFLHQETQFKDMLKKQAVQKNVLENVIRLQEERFRLQIQTLFAAPTLHTSFRNNLVDEQTIVNVDMANFNDELNKLKEENQRLQNLLTGLSDNHLKELGQIEETYKNHIKLLEKNLELSRERGFSEETAKLFEGYDKKLQDIEEQHDSSVANLRKYYDTEIEMLRKDFKWMNEHISNQCKSTELVTKYSNESLQTFDVALVNLKDMAKKICEMVNEIHSATPKEFSQREENLTTREKQLEGIEQRLQLLDQSFQTEQKKLLELVRPLEALLKNLTEGYTKKNVYLLHAERMSLHRERELFLELVEKKDHRIQESQKLHEAEKTVLMRQIQEEWHLLNMEKKKLSVKMERDSISNFLDSADSKLRIGNDKERDVPIPNVLEPKSCAIVKEPQYWESIKDEFQKGIQHLRIVELQAHESLQRAELAEKRFNCTIQTLIEQMQHMTLRDARLSKGRFQLAQGHLQLRRSASKEHNILCRCCKRAFETHQDYFGSKLWVDSFFNVHGTADHLKYLDCYIHSSNES